MSRRTISTHWKKKNNVNCIALLYVLSQASRDELDRKMIGFLGKIMYINCLYIHVMRFFFVYF